MKTLTFWLQPQDILKDSGPLSKAKEILHREEVFEAKVPRQFTIHLSFRGKASPRRSRQWRMRCSQSPPRGSWGCCPRLRYQLTNADDDIFRS